MPGGPAAPVPCTRFHEAYCEEATTSVTPTPLPENPQYRRGGAGSPPLAGLRISRRRAFWATVALIATAGCGDVVDPQSPVLARSQLLILRLQTSAPAPATATFSVANAAATVHVIVHDDQFNTPFLTLEFPAGCVESVAGQSLGQGESASVTAAPTSGLYGFTLSPSSLMLTEGCSSTAKFSFGRYADFSVADGSSTYLDRAAYAAALELWRETGPDRWKIVPQSGPSGNDAVEGNMETSGSYLLAAPR